MNTISSRLIPSSGITFCTSWAIRPICESSGSFRSSYPLLSKLYFLPGLSSTFYKKSTKNTYETCFGKNSHLSNFPSHVATSRLSSHCDFWHNNTSISTKVVIALHHRREFNIVVCHVAEKYSYSSRGSRKREEWNANTHECHPLEGRRSRRRMQSWSNNKVTISPIIMVLTLRLLAVILAESTWAREY